MRKYLLLAIVAMSGVMIGTVAQAQTPPAAPAPIPDAIPFDVPYGMPITLERAKKAAEAAAAEAKKRNWKMAIAIVERLNRFPIVISLCFRPLRRAALES